MVFRSGWLGVTAPSHPLFQFIHKSFLQFIFWAIFLIRFSNCTFANTLDEIPTTLGIVANSYLTLDELPPLASNIVTTPLQAPSQHHPISAQDHPARKHWSSGSKLPHSNVPQIHRMRIFSEIFHCKCMRACVQTVALQDAPQSVLRCELPGPRMHTPRSTSARHRARGANRCRPTRK